MATGAWLQTASPNTNLQEEQGLKADQAAANNKEGLLANTFGYFVSLVDGDGQYGASITYDRLDFNYQIPICDSSCTYGKQFYTPSHDLAYKIVCRKCMMSHKLEFGN